MATQRWYVTAHWRNIKDGTNIRQQMYERARNYQEVVKLLFDRADNTGLELLQYAITPAGHEARGPTGMEVTHPEPKAEAPPAPSWKEDVTVVRPAIYEISAKRKEGDKDATAAP